MSSDLQLIKRTIATVQGSDLPRDVVRFLEDGFTNILHSPGITMDAAFGLRRSTGKRKVWSDYGQQERARLIQSFYARHYSQYVSKYRASQLLAYDLGAMQSGTAAEFPAEYVQLFESLRQLPVALPTSKSEVYKNLRFTLKDPL